MAIISVTDIRKILLHLPCTYRLQICMFDCKLKLTCMIIGSDIITQKKKKKNWTWHISNAHEREIEKYNCIFHAHVNLYVQQIKICYMFTNS